MVGDAFSRDICIKKCYDSLESPRACLVNMTEPIACYIIPACSYSSPQPPQLLAACSLYPEYLANHKHYLAKIQIVDQTAELENFYSVDDPEPEPIPTAERPKSAPRPPSSVDSSISFPQPPRLETTSHSPRQQSIGRFETATKSPTYVSPASFDNILSFSGAKRRRTNDSTTPSEHYRPIQLPPISQELQNHLPVRNSPSNSSYHSSTYYNYASPTEANETRRIEAEYARLADSEAAKIPDEPLLSFASWKKNFRWPNQYTTQQCVCLFKYYIDVLGPWVSIYASSINQMLTMTARRWRSYAAVYISRPPTSTKMSTSTQCDLLCCSSSPSLRLEAQVTEQNYPLCRLGSTRSQPGLNYKVLPSHDSIPTCSL